MDTSSVLNLWGNPGAEAPYWREQQRNDSCDVVAQASIYQSITGQYVSEEEACQIAASQGWFSEGKGTPAEYSGNLLNHLDVPISRTYGATLEDIKSALTDGKKVLVGVDAREIWAPVWDEFEMPVEQADLGHTVWVTGVKQELDGSYQIVLNDSGTWYGQEFSVDYEDFANAWQDEDFALVVANDFNTSNWIVGTQGADEMLGGTNGDWFDGQGGRDILIGAMGSDTLIGGSGADTLIGGSGNDLLIGGRGINSNKTIAKVKDGDKDIMIGGSGRDVFAIAKGRERDVIGDFKNGVDQLGLTAGIKYGQLDFTQKGNNTIVSIGNDQLAILQGVKVNQISRADFTTVHNQVFS
jgi:hypothetical protein